MVSIVQGPRFLVFYTCSVYMVCLHQKAKSRDFCLLSGDSPKREIIENIVIFDQLSLAFFISVSMINSHSGQLECILCGSCGVHLLQ